MSLFDQLVDEAIRSRTDHAVLRPVVEKELLHHDIFREMSAAGLLAGLTFIGGTCLRACYGSPRLSEDLDFTGGVNFRREDLAGLAEVLTERLSTRYELPVRVSEPQQTGGRVSTWKLRIETRPEQRHLPAQRIHLDICALPSYDVRPVTLRNLYEVDLGTSGLILRAESREEILADKLIALAFRENRLKNRDLWDIAWLTQRGVELPVTLIPRKVHDHGRDDKEFRNSLGDRLAHLETDEARVDFLNEMRRFLPSATVEETLQKEEYWQWLRGVVVELSRLVA
ncbi:MAG: nucleotidyl transferase AbiEii/AbiGii toxin family protein [Verrucomicrobia bacterium]|nr:nucleotidyl transferase AbiEii/AbiGii toxin family protein [Verrucomicrobiota bacterium]MDA1005074.1 nucleotidyl transferase AbiEii/AbiGii toxin family protein [Verrucomicrobiota bacterium]